MRWKWLIKAPLDPQSESSSTLLPFFISHQPFLLSSFLTNFYCPSHKIDSTRREVVQVWITTHRKRRPRGGAAENSGLLVPCSHRSSQIKISEKKQRKLSMKTKEKRVCFLSCDCAREQAHLTAPNNCHRRPIRLEHTDILSLTWTHTHRAVLLPIWRDQFSFTFDQYHRQRRVLIIDGWINDIGH